MKMTNTENNGPALPPGVEFGPETGGDGERIACLADFGRAILAVGCRRHDAVPVPAQCGERPSG